MKVNYLPLQKAARPLEVHGNMESRLLFEALYDSFKANRRDLIIQIPKVCVQSNHGAGRYGLLERHSGPVTTNVVDHSLHLHLVVLSIRNVDGDWTSNLKSFGITHKE